MLGLPSPSHSVDLIVHEVIRLDVVVRSTPDRADGAKARLECRPPETKPVPPASSSVSQVHDLAVKPKLELISAAAFDERIAVHLEAGYRVALAILRDPDEARDAVQDAAFKAWRRFGQLRDGRAARPWFLSIVANQCRSVRRRHWWSVGSGLQRINDNGAWPSWSSDGSRLAFTRGADRFTMSRDGSDVRQVEGVVVAPPYQWAWNPVVGR
jgi:hypothetical protein